MNFFAQQEKIQKLSRYLSILFGLCVIAVVIALTCGLYFLLKIEEVGLTGRALYAVLCVFSLIVTSTILLGAYIKFRQSSAGGISIALDLNGRLIDPSTSDMQERRLLNIVEEMAIAARLPMIEVLIFDNDQTINAFTVGLTPSDAAIAVTSGALKHLSRDELQGVIGHEMGHIRNGDIRLSLKILSSIYGLSIVSIMGRIILQGTPRSSSRSRKGLGPVVLIGLLFWLAGLIGVFFGKILQSAISRQREYLADASSVQFTRNSDSLANALKKIGGMIPRWLKSSDVTFEHRHFFFVSPIYSDWNSLFSTHPPLISRIRALQPRFNGRFEEYAEPSANDEEEILPVSSFSPLPENIRIQCRDPASSCALIQDLLKRESSPNSSRSQISLTQCLMAVRTCLPSIRKLSVNQHADLMQHLKQIAEQDRKLSLYEYTILKMVNDSKPTPKRMKLAHYYSFKRLVPDLEVLVSSMAYISTEDATAAENITRSIGEKLGLSLRTLSPQECKISNLDSALKRLSLATPKMKEQIVTIIQEMAKADSVIHDNEALLIELVEFSLSAT